MLTNGRAEPQLPPSVFSKKAVDVIPSEARDLLFAPVASQGSFRYAVRPLPAPTLSVGSRKFPRHIPAVIQELNHRIAFRIHAHHQPVAPLLVLDPQ